MKNDKDMPKRSVDGFTGKIKDKTVNDLAEKLKNRVTSKPNQKGDLAEKLGKQVAELTADLQRTRADFENYRKQVDIQKAQLVESTRLDTVKKILPLLDDIDRAIAAHVELAPLEKSLEKTLSELKLAKMDTAEGVEFNPDFHDAISMEETEGNTEVISETLRPGYLYDESVLRPAMVRVKRV